MLIRSTWASHVRSRNGAGDGDGGAGTSRTIVRFIMGQPRRAWDRRVRLEMEGAPCLTPTLDGPNLSFCVALSCGMCRIQ
jgi:hypothetical protein